MKKTLETKPQLIQISAAWNSREGAPLGRNQYVELEIKKPKLNGASIKLSAVQKPCDKMAEAIVMDGGKRGQVVKVCADPACHVHQFLGQFEGLLQTDGYAAYDKIGGPKIVHAGCWSHSERYFSEAVKLNPQDPVARAIVARIDELFAIDAEARSQRLSLEARDALRQQQSRPLLGVIQKQIEAARSTALPGGALSKACNYTLTLWPKLTRFLEYPELELSTNLAENSMRPVALGRRNWIHVGSPQAGPKIAAILSVVESCRRLKLPVRDYLAAILPGLADLPIQRLPGLTPTAWANRHPA